MNLKTVIEATPDPDRKRELLGQFNKTMNFAEEIAKKISTDPEKYDI